MKKQYDSTPQIEQFLQKITDFSDHKIGVLSGLPGPEMKQLINSSVMLVAKGGTGQWKLAKEADHSTCVSDLQAVLLANVRPEFLGNRSHSNLVRRWWTRYVAWKIRRLRNLKVAEEQDQKTVSGRTRTVLWTVVSALSSLGLAMGIPLFSLLLYRQQAIIDGRLGEGFFVGFLAFSIALIVMAILGTVVSLLNNLINQQKEYSWQNIDKVYARFIRRYFTVKDRGHWWQFHLRKQYCFFYTNVDSNHKRYLDLLHLFRVFLLTGSTVCYALNLGQEFDPNQIASRPGFQPSQFKLFRLNEHKNNVRSATILAWLTKMLKQITGVAEQALLHQNALLTNAIYQFLDYFEWNQQVLDFLNQVQKFVGNQPVQIADSQLDYLADLVTLAAWKGIDGEGFDQFLRRMLENGIPTPADRTGRFYRLFQIDQLLNQNLVHYQSHALFFHLNDFFENNWTLREMITDGVFIEPRVEESTNQQMMTVLKNRGYRITPCDLKEYQMAFISAYGEKLYVRDVKTDFHQLLPLDVFQRALDDAKEANLPNLVITFGKEKQFYRWMDDHYDLILNFFN